VDDNVLNDESKEADEEARDGDEGVARTTEATWSSNFCLLSPFGEPVSASGCLRFLEGVAPSPGICVSAAFVSTEASSVMRSAEGEGEAAAPIDDVDGEGSGDATDGECATFCDFDLAAFGVRFTSAELDDGEYDEDEEDSDEEEVEVRSAEREAGTDKYGSYVAERFESSAKRPSGSSSSSSKRACEGKMTGGMLIISVNKSRDQQKNPTKPNQTNKKAHASDRKRGSDEDI